MTDSKVVSLSKQDRSERCIEGLQEMLEKAIKGEIVGVGIIAVTRDGRSFTCVDADGPLNADLMLGAAHRLAGRIENQWEEIESWRAWYF